MNTTDIIWTALTKTADSLERDRRSASASLGDIAAALREIADQIATMKQFDAADHTRLATIEEHLGIEP